MRKSESHILNRRMKAFKALIPTKYVLLLCSWKDLLYNLCTELTLAHVPVQWNDAQTELGFSCMHAACFGLYAVNKVLSCSLTGPVGLGAGLMTADLPAPLQAAAALCPAVWGLCQGFLHRCARGSQSSWGAKWRWRWGEAFGPSSALS